MNRREFITLVGGAAAVWPVLARAQQGERVRRVGILMPYLERDPEAQDRIAAFRKEFTKFGWTDEKVRFEVRWSGPGDLNSIRPYARELVATEPDAILVNAPRALAALQEATRTIPLVFVGVSDPIAVGFVKSLARPGGNITGFALIEFSVIGKSMEMLKQIAPGITQIAMMSNPANPSTPLYMRSFEIAAKANGLNYFAAPVGNPDEIERTIRTVASTPNSSLLVPPDVTVQTYRELVARLAAQHHLPAVYSNRVVPASGGLISYGTDVTDQFRKAASYVDRILRGERPGDLPVQQPTNFELVINLKAAKALGLEVPPMLLARADEVIE